MRNRWFALESWRLPGDVECKQIEIVFLATPKNLLSGLAALVLIASGMLLMSQQHGKLPLVQRDTLAIAVWAFLQAAILVRGLLTARYFIRTRPDEHGTRALGRKLAINGLLAGTLWGSLGFIALGFHNMEQLGFVITSVALVVMGGAGAQAPWRPLVVLFVVSVTTVFVAALLVNPSVHPIIPPGFVLYAYVALEFAGQHQKSVRRIIELNIENERLLQGAHDAVVALQEAKDVADQANLEKTRFLAAVSHDLRQPMHALNLYLAHLRGLAVDDTVLAGVEKVEAAARAMDTLLDGVFDLSRIALGSIRPSRQVVSIDAICADLLVQLMPDARDKGLILTVERSAVHAISDPLLLERILRNLWMNALRYTDHGRVLCRALRRGNNAVILVADTGIGIPSTEFEHIFEAFYQIANMERDRTKGTGLGLAIVRQLCELMGIAVRLKSRPGRGTVVRLVLPNAVAAPVEHAAGDGSAPVSSAPLSGAVVLVIEDDALVLDSTRLLLNQLGCAVIGASSGAEALAALDADERSPDIIISDYRLRNGETGVQAIERVRRQLHEDDDGPVTPAILISGDTEAGELGQVSGARIPVLHKPVSELALVSTLIALIEQYERQLP